MENDATVEGLLVGHLGRLLDVVTASGDDDTWQRRVSSGTIAFARLVGGLTEKDVDIPPGVHDSDPDVSVVACLDLLRDATQRAADSGLIPSRRLFVEDVEPLLDAIWEARGGV